MLYSELSFLDPVKAATGSDYCYYFTLLEEIKY